MSVWEGNPWRPKYRVGAFSHLDEIYAARTISRAAAPRSFRRTAVELSYRFQGHPSSLAEYLSRNPVTGPLIAKDNEILFEHYQYARTDSDRFVSQSMVASSGLPSHLSPASLACYGSTRKQNRRRYVRIRG